MSAGESTVIAGCQQIINFVIFLTDIQKVQVEKLPAKEGPRNLVSFLAADFLRLPVGVWIIVAAVLIGLTISLAVELGRTGDTGGYLKMFEAEKISSICRENRLELFWRKLNGR